MTWILVMCTSGWVLCGQLQEIRYPNEAACYRAIEELYKRNPRDRFKYVICRPATAKDKAP